MQRMPRWGHQDKWGAIRKTLDPGRIINSSANRRYQFNYRSWRHAETSLDVWSSTGVHQPTNPHPG